MHQPSKQDPRGREDCVLRSDEAETCSRRTMIETGVVRNIASTSASQAEGTTSNVEQYRRVRSPQRGSYRPWLSLLNRLEVDALSRIRE